MKLRVLFTTPNPCLLSTGTSYIVASTIGRGHRFSAQVEWEGGLGAALCKGPPGPIECEHLSTGGGRYALHPEAGDVLLLSGPWTEFALVCSLVPKWR